MSLDYEAKAAADLSSPETGLLKMTSQGLEAMRWLEDHGADDKVGDGVILESPAAPANKGS